MSKTNFTKVEESLIKGMDQTTVDRLLEASGKSDNTSTPSELRLRLRQLQHVLRWLLKLDKDSPTKLEATHDEILRFVHANPADLKPADWTRVEELQARCTALKAEIAKTSPVATNEALVRKERRKHRNKRFNVSDKWLPLQ